MICETLKKRTDGLDKEQAIRSLEHRFNGVFNKTLSIDELSKDEFDLLAHLPVKGFCHKNGRPMYKLKTESV